MPLIRALPLIALLAAGCASTRTPVHPADELWSALEPLCGKAFEGRLAEGTEPSDAAIAKERLVMHVRQCTPDEIRIPFHVGDNRSRTWILARTPSGVRLAHDHRHEDGSEDRITQYGGATRGSTASRSLDFFADDFTANLIPAAATNIWTVGVDDDGRTFTYGLRREAQGRRFRVTFDLTRPVPPPPPPW